MIVLYKRARAEWLDLLPAGLAQALLVAADEAAGYRDLREIEWDDYHYDVKGRNAQGARVKLEVDGQTGAVLRSRIKH